MSGHNWYVYDVAFTPDGNRVASVAWDKTARLWDATTGRQLALLEHQEKILEALAVSPEGHRLAVLEGRAGRVQVWDMASARPLYTAEAGELLRCVVWDRRGATLVAAGREGRIHRWDGTHGRPAEFVRSPHGEIAGLAKTGSLVPASEIISGTLYMLGPSGSLYALTAQGLAEIGQCRRPISDQEYAWANSKVFAGSLAPRGQIIVTDTIGAGGRAFTFPGPGDITVNPTALKFPELYPILGDSTL